MHYQSQQLLKKHMINWCPFLTLITTTAAAIRRWPPAHDLTTAVGQAGRTPSVKSKSRPGASGPRRRRPETPLGRALPRPEGE